MHVPIAPQHVVGEAAGSSNVGGANLPREVWMADGAVHRGQVGVATIALVSDYVSQLEGINSWLRTSRDGIDTLRPA